MLKQIPLVLLASALLSCAPFQDSVDRDAIQVAVSILPQADFVERIGGDRVSVTVMVKAGQSPHTFEPTPRQIASLSEAKAYFRIGVPFETVWIDKFQQVNPSMKVVGTHEGVPLRAMEGRHHEDDRSHEGHAHEDHGEGANDPHIWLDPTLVKIQAQHIAAALCELDPDGKETYERNLAELIDDLDRLDAEIKETLSGIRTHTFLIFHPSWGYFADAYGLEQEPIELEGKEPTARQLTELVSAANEENLKTIFIQPQFSKRVADSIAQTVGGEAVTLDPLARDYFANMRETARKLKKALQ